MDAHLVKIVFVLAGWRENQSGTDSVDADVGSQFFGRHSCEFQKGPLRECIDKMVDIGPRDPCVQDIKDLSLAATTRKITREEERRFEVNVEVSIKEVFVCFHQPCALEDGGVIDKKTAVRENFKDLGNERGYSP